MGITVQLGNLLTGETMTAQYAPVELKESYGAEYASQSVPGLSHKLMQFVSGENAAIDLDLEFSQLAEPKVPIDEQRKFLLSLLAPSKKAQNVASGAPPRVLFYWPQLFSLTCRMPKLEIVHSLFQETGATAMFKAKLHLDEARDTRLYSEDVRRVGTIRGA